MLTSRGALSATVFVLVVDGRPARKNRPDPEGAGLSQRAGTVSVPASQVESRP
ncbi:hypothetical protein [Cryobacterium fucosi]|uniref:hypothetical protein n=1 Tax=Cryobacterium fucosi TaxID=1259157 RepID=UPI00141B8368|nr:hypothetical protein [Cryobacterium fucosi]